MASPRQGIICTIIRPPSSLDPQVYLHMASVALVSYMYTQLIPTRTGIPADPIDEWGAELLRGIEVEDAILTREGPRCLSRPEYQLQPNESDIETPFSLQNVDLSPYDSSLPQSSESPDSILSQTGSGIFPQARSQDRYRDNSKKPSLKRFKCHLPGCIYAYSADRQDHVNDHYKAYHQGNPYKCDLWYVSNPTSRS